MLSAFNPAPGLSDEPFRIFMVIAAIGTVFAAGYLLDFQRVVFGEPKPQFADAHIHDVSRPSGSRGRRCSASSSCSASTRNIFSLTNPGVTRIVAKHDAVAFGALT